MSLHTKKDFQDALFKIINPLIDKYSEKGANLYVGHTSSVYEETTIPMEAFSRVLWGLVPFWKGGGRSEIFEKIYQSGLAAGTDKESGEYWGGFRPYDQLFVEMAAISYGLILVPEILWDPLNDKAKENLAWWLYQINNYEYPDNNWKFFGVLVNVALKKVGTKYSKEKLNEFLECVESYYIGNGWYKDGISEQKDYYIAFAMHFYGLIYSANMQDEDPDRCAVFKERAMIFAKDFIYWFDEDGEAIAFGRSQTYRFAQASFWSACVYAGIEPYPYGVMKGIISRHLEYWMRQPIFDNGDILTIGYAYPNIHMSESYNAPGSPYWGLKVFAILALEDDHPFWAADELPMPDLEPAKVIEEAEMLIIRKPHHVIDYVSGNYQARTQNHLNCKYSKFVYSSKFGFSVPRGNNGLNQAAPDSMLAFDIDGLIFVRMANDEGNVSENGTWSKWSPIRGIVVETEIILTDTGHIRRHRIYSDYECQAWDCGFAVDCKKSLSKEVSKKCAKAENEWSMCSVNGENASCADVLSADPNTNLISSKTVIPAVCYNIVKGENKFETIVEFGIK